MNSTQSGRGETRVFLSYARGDDPPDQPFVRRLHADLTAAGFTMWYDRENQEEP